MKKIAWLISGTLALVLAATPVMAMEVLWDRFDLPTGCGYCMVMMDNHTTWLIHYVDNPNSRGTIGAYDMNDVVIWKIQICNDRLVCTSRPGLPVMAPGQTVPIPLGSG